MSFYSYGVASWPGIELDRTSVEGAITWGRSELWFPMGIAIDGTARDAGHTDNTTILRPGLLIEASATTKLWKEWAGTREPAVLLYAVQTQDGSGNRNRWFGFALPSGHVRSEAIIYPGEDPGGWIGGVNDAATRAALASRYVLDDQFYV